MNGTQGTVQVQQPTSNECTVPKSTLGKYIVCEFMSKNLTDMRDRNEYTDVIIKSEGKEFPCHKLVLSAVSPYFGAMFRSGMLEATSNKVTIRDIPADVMGCVLDAFYGKEITLTEGNVEGLLDAAAMFEIELLVVDCEKYLCDLIKQSTCLNYIYLALKYNLKDLHMKAVKYILLHFIKISQDEQFMEVDVELLEQLIKKDQLVVPNEDFVFNTVVRWFEHNPTKRAEHITKLLRHVHFPLMSPSSLVSTDPKDCVRKSKMYATLAQEGIMYQLSLARRPDMTSRRCLQRIFSQLEDVIVVIGGNTVKADYHGVLSNTTVRDVSAFGLLSGKWSNLAPLPIDPGAGFAVSVYGSVIYVTGGTKAPSWIQRFDQNVWTTENGHLFHGNYLKHNLFHRMFHSSEIVGDILYILGGSDQSKAYSEEVWQFSIPGNSWDLKRGHIAIPVHSPSTAVLGNRIYMFGGSNRWTEKLPVQYFDTISGNASSFVDLTVPKCYLRAVAYDRKIFVLTENQELLLFEDGPKPRLSVVLVTGDFSPAAGFGAGQFRGLLYLIGGMYSDTRFDHSMILVSPNSVDQKDLHYVSSKSQRMNGGRAHFGCVRLPISRRYLKDKKYVVPT